MSLTKVPFPMVRSIGVINVQDYGADPTGVVDSVTAFRNALAACFPTSATYSSGGIDYYVATASLYVPPGIYKTSGTIYAPLSFSSTKHMVGLRVYGPKLRAVYAGTANGLNPAQATIVADTGAVWSINQSVIDLQYGNYCVIDNLAIRGISAYTKGIDISNGGGWETKSLSLYQHKYGIYSNASGMALHRDSGISNCTNAALYMKDSGDSDIQGMYINTNNQDYATDLNKGWGIYLATSNNTNIRGGKIEYNAIGVYLNDTQGINISGVNFDLNGQSHILMNYTSAAGTAPNSLQLKSINISGNRFLSGGNLAGASIPGAHIHCYASSSNSHITIVGNSFRKGSGSAYDENPNPPGVQPVGPTTYCVYAEVTGNSSYYNTFAVNGNDFFNGSAINTIGGIASSGANMTFAGSNIGNLPNYSLGSNVDFTNLGLYS